MAPLMFSPAYGWGGQAVYFYPRPGNVTRTWVIDTDRRQNLGLGWLARFQHNKLTSTTSKTFVLAFSQYNGMALAIWPHKMYYLECTKMCHLRSKIFHCREDGDSGQPLPTTPHSHTPLPRGLRSLDCSPTIQHVPIPLSDECFSHREKGHTIL